MIEMFLFAAIIIIGVLAAVAIALHWRLHKLRIKQREDRRAHEAKRVEQRERINNSIQIIARATEEKQVGATEASIRISVLLDALDVRPDIKHEFATFYKLAEEAAHVPIMDAWKALPRQERVAYERELEALEEKYQDFIVDAAKRIQGRHF